MCVSTAANPLSAAGSLLRRTRVYNTAMTEAVDTIFKEIQDFPPDLHPFVRSTLMTRIAADFESKHDYTGTKASWNANSALIHEELQNLIRKEYFIGQYF